MFELLGQSAGDPYVDEDDIPVVLRSWQAQNFLITSLHVKGSASSINVLGITEVQVCSYLNRILNSSDKLVNYSRMIKFLLMLDSQLLVFFYDLGTSFGWW